MTSPYPHEEQFYAEVPQRRNRPSSTSSVSPFFMSHQSPTAGGGSDPSYGQGRYDWVHNGTQVSRNPSSNLSKATTDRSSDNYASEAPENAAKHSYGAAHLGFLNDELLSPGAVDEMHDFEKKTPRIGASRYISEASGSFTLWSPRGWLNICALLIMVCGLMMLFAGWPILSYFKEHSLRDLVSGFGGQKTWVATCEPLLFLAFESSLTPTPRVRRDTELGLMEKNTSLCSVTNSMLTAVLSGKGMILSGRPLTNTIGQLVTENGMTLTLPGRRVAHW
ncbi:hypothetical protein Pst134EB_010781 [Puccinia striiformis f. sp. tritici]|nr:hypothetical protein Pst134EB_010781 [Puccinia striiformis f. sp. tritici]